MTKHAQIIYLEFFCLRWDEVGKHFDYSLKEYRILEKEYGEFLESEGFPGMSADDLKTDLILNRHPTP